MPVKSALTLIAHGSKNTLANQHIHYLVDELMLICRDKYHFINYGFLQFAKPSIEDAIIVHIKNNIKNIHIFPFFLAPGNHVDKDIPNIMHEIKLRHDDVNLIMLPPFGCNQNMAMWISSLL